MRRTAARTGGTGASGTADRGAAPDVWGGAGIHEESLARELRPRVDHRGGGTAGAGTARTACRTAPSAPGGTRWRAVVRGAVPGKDVEVPQGAAIGVDPERDAEPQTVSTASRVSTGGVIAPEKGQRVAWRRRGRPGPGGPQRSPGLCHVPGRLTESVLLCQQLLMATLQSDTQ